MIYCKICKCLKKEVKSGDLRGTTEDLEFIESLETVTLIKIGYTKDEEENQPRDSCYRTENPNIIHYQYYPGGTREDEIAFHKRFQDKKFKGREWFILDKEILEFLQRNKTLKDVRCELVEFYNLEESIVYKIHNLAIILLKFTNPEINTSDLKYPLVENSLEKELSRVYIIEGELEPFLETTYPGFNISDFNERLKWIEENKEIVKEEVLYFEGIPNFIDKMKYLCSLKETLDLEHFNVFLNYIPGEFKNFIEVLGIDEIRACSYQRSKIFEKWSKVMNISDKADILKSRVYIEFHEGEKYSKSDIKQKLKEVYIELDYRKTPKASDLSNFFDVRACQITNKETGKRDNGFEIVSKK